MLQIFWVDRRGDAWTWCRGMDVGCRPGGGGVTLGRRGRNRNPGAVFIRATNRWNVRTMNREKEWARHFHINMTKTQRTKGEKKHKIKSQDDIQHVNSTRTMYFHGDTRTYVPQHKKDLEGYASAVVRTLCPRQGWGWGWHSWYGQQKALRWEDGFSTPPASYSFMCSFFSNENLFSYLSGEKQMANTRRMSLLEVVGSTARASAEQSVQHSSRT